MQLIQFVQAFGTIKLCPDQIKQYDVDVSLKISHFTKIVSKATLCQFLGWQIFLEVLTIGQGAGKFGTESRKSHQYPLGHQGRYSRKDHP